MPDQDPLVNQSLYLVQRTTIVPLILETICRTTGLGFAAVARVTPERWIACEVRDEIHFGLRSGEELKVDTTICHEIRQSGGEVLIDQVAIDECYAAHPTPAMYGFQSYISVPIWLTGKQFFGTLCAIDPSPAMLKNTPIRELFKTYAALIAFLMDAELTTTSVKTEPLRQRCAAVLREHVFRMTGVRLGQPLTAARTSPEAKAHLLTDHALNREILALNDVLKAMQGSL